MNNGWIKLHRKLIDKGYYKKSQYIHLWVHLLLTANHKTSEFIWNNKIIKIREGQFITGRERLSLETGISQTTIERILSLLEKEHQIGQRKTTKFRLITIINWNKFQQADSRRTASGQQADTYNNDKNDKKYIFSNKSTKTDGFKSLKELTGEKLAKISQGAR